MRMGASLSRKKHDDKSVWSGPPGDHSPFPLDPVPYPGSDILYCFVDITVAYKFMRNDVNLGPQVVTTDIDEHVEDILDCYEDGFSLNEFVKIPFVKCTTEIQDWSEEYPYHAVLSKPTVRELGTEDESWTLKIEKRILSTRTLSLDETDTDSELIQTINAYSEMGARLVCVAPVGYIRSKSTNTQYSVIGVELFFNIPKHKRPTKYTYHPVKIHANYHIVPDATQTIQQIICDVDFMAQLSLFLNKGWKLVDICIDTTAIAEAYKMRATSKMVDTIWVFEKEEDKLLDDSPAYEGVIIEYLHKVKVTMNGEHACRDWRPVIAGMGVSGWELAAIIQTPLLVQSSFTTYTMKLLMIFQRKILASFEKMKKLKVASSLPNMRDQGQFFRTLMHGEGGGTHSGTAKPRASGSARGSGIVYQNSTRHRRAGVAEQRPLDKSSILDNLINGSIQIGETTLSRLYGDDWQPVAPPTYWEAIHTSSAEEIGIS